MLYFNIGMMIESMAGKSASLHGITHDSTPFKFSEDDPAADYMGEMLLNGTLYHFHYFVVSFLQKRLD